MRTIGEKVERVDEFAASLCHLADGDRTDFVTDLLADVMHWCDARGVDFRHGLWRAQMHYREERAEADAARGALHRRVLRVEVRVRVSGLEWLSYAEDADFDDCHDWPRSPTLPANDA